MAQDWEMWLRKEIYWAETMKDDKVVEAKLYLPYQAVDTGWGIEEERIGDPTKGEAYVWKSPLADLEEEEFEELDLSTVVKTPEIHIDWEACARPVAFLLQPARYGEHDVRLLRLPGQGARDDAAVYRRLSREVRLSREKRAASEQLRKYVHRLGRHGLDERAARHAGTGQADGYVGL